MNLTSAAQDTAARTALGPGVLLFGWLTLNDAALIAGIICSVIITLKTAIDIWHTMQDRRAKAADDRARGAA